MKDEESNHFWYRWNLPENQVQLKKIEKINYEKYYSTLKRQHEEDLC